MFGDAGGGYNETERTRWAKELAQRPLDGDNFTLSVFVENIYDNG